MNTSKLFIMAAICVWVGGCKQIDKSGWYLKSLKGNTITLHHDGKVFVAKCKGEHFQTPPDQIYSMECVYLVQYIGATLPDGDDDHCISQLGTEIVYWRSRKTEPQRAYEVWTIVEETAN